MNKKYECVPVTNMTFGQLYDAVANGGEFYDDGKHKISIDDLGFMESRCYEQTELIKQLSSGEITRRVEIDWREQLDETWENGVWCKVWGCNESSLILRKVVSYNDEANWHYGCKCSHWRNATPVSEELAELLEKEFPND